MVVDGTTSRALTAMMAGFKALGRKTKPIDRAQLDQKMSSAESRPPDIF